LAICVLLSSLLAARAIRASAAENKATDAGLFETHRDIGECPKAGASTFDAARGEYRITGGGANIWFATDAFQFLAKPVEGDFTLTADVRFEGAGAVAHRKAVLMARQTLDANAAYADVALHGDGLTSLQYRPSAGENTLEARADIKSPSRIRLERHGSVFTAYAGAGDGKLRPVAVAVVQLGEPVYVGLGVSSHDAQVLETAVFSHVALDLPKPGANVKYRSYISIFDVSKKSASVVHSADTIWEAPNWSADGKFLLANSGGALYQIPVDANGTASPEMIQMGDGYRCNNDHGLTLDGKKLAFSASTTSSRASQVFIMDWAERKPQQLTTVGPSYFHGWAPDGKSMAIVAQRDGNFDLFRIPAEGGSEQRLTTSPGYDDGPDYSPNGEWIYFNSNRSGSWDIWRMPATGAGPNDKLAEQVTSDEWEDWFPHPSPDGQWLLFLSFPPGTENHNGKTDVELRMMPLPGEKASGGAITTVTKFFGGQGTINVNSWSPDSKRFAFVRYEAVP
jgi:Tol biopolymer transport system component